MRLIYKDEDELKQYLISIKRKYGMDWREWFQKIRDQGMFIFTRNGKSYMESAIEKLMND